MSPVSPEMLSEVAEQAHPSPKNIHGELDFSEGELCNITLSSLFNIIQWQDMTEMMQLMTKDSSCALSCSMCSTVR